MADDYRRGPVRNFHHAQCCAITRGGTRCTGRWSTACPCVFWWDAETGDGIDGPHVVLCHRHRSFVYSDAIKSGKRIRVMHGGWLGDANRYGYGTAVFASRTGVRPALWWWVRRRESSYRDHCTSPRWDAA
jgi:hypothetical protein